MPVQKINFSVIMLETFILLIVLFSTITECKYCWHTSHFGKSTHFYCGAFEYCCGDKCCENFDEFYKLWYFWLCILVLILSSCIAIYWLRRRYLLQHLFPNSQDGPRETRPGRRGRHRRYRQLTGDSIGATPPPVIIPDSIITAPPSYGSSNTGCPHQGPPPYSLGSGSSINSQTLPPFPPSYSKISKEPPPSYSEFVEVVVMTSDNCSKKSCDNDDSQS